MRTPITFPAVSSEEVSEEPIIIEAVIEGYLVRIIYVDQGASVEVMFEHCFENLNPAIKSRLKSTQTDLVGFAKEVVKPLGKIELVVVLENVRFCLGAVMMKFTIIELLHRTMSFLLEEPV
ncbi:hypothetical protein Tco_1296530 [Tanacetum coccineum]